MKRMLIVASLGIAAIGLLAAFGFGGPMMHRAMMDPKKVDGFVTWRLNDALDDVNATPQQRAQILAIKDRLMPDVKALMEQRKAHHGEVKQLWLSDSLDAKVVHGKIDARAEEMRQLAHKVADGVIEAQKLLTPAQRAQLAERAEKMRENFEHP